MRNIGQLAASARSLSSRARTGLALTCLCALLAACGGGSGGGGDGSSDPVVTPTSPPPTTPPPPPPAPAVGSLQGRVSSAADGSPLAGATVVAPGRPAVTTAADGSFSLTGLAPGERVLVRVEATGHAATLGVVKVQADSSANLALVLLPAAAPQLIDPATASVVQDPVSGARLSVAAGAWRRSDNGAAPAGPLTVRLTAVDPARDAARMPGDFSTLVSGQPRLIESFGAVAVDVRDAAGNSYTLASGQSAGLRIPASSRAALPASVGLYALGESSGRWVAEGSATLAGSGSSRWYEATVTHLSWWNADLPLETIAVNGCLRTVAGLAAVGRTVMTDGLDYSGQAVATSDAGGRFSVAMKRGGRATLSVPGAGDTSPLPRTVGPSQTDITLTDCLQERNADALAPQLLRQPLSFVGRPGDRVDLDVEARGSAPLSYQWRRNGQLLAGETANRLTLVLREADNGAQYTVTVANAQGSVTSEPALMTVNLGTGISGTLTVSGDAQGLSAGSFVVNVNSSLNTVNSAGPDCVGNQSCLSTFSVVAFEGLGLEGVSVVLISQAPVPGVQPGTSATAVTVGYAVADVQAQVTRTYGSGCGLASPPCADGSSLGVNLNLATRTLTFSNARLPLSTDPGRVTVLNGVLRY